ncbi:MAG: rubrerythrin family protein [Candidatus Eisenbacteria bacterium]|nr:rubrerythrin family protein [Candidatus Eisenbacteria bacterium]
MKRLILPLILSILLLTFVSSLVQSGGVRHVTGTTKALQTLYAEEFNDYLAYRSYAVQAQRDGAREAATLFRALAQAELAHTALHAAALRWIGVEPKAEHMKPEVGTVDENLRRALAREQQVATDLYTPLSVEIAPERVENALRALNFAEQAEHSHEQILTAMLEHARLVEVWGDSLAPAWTATTLYVCPTCGLVSTTTATDHCAVCYGDPKAALAVK